MLALKDKVCLVTGAATGLGRAISEELLRNGASVSSETSKKLKFPTVVSLCRFQFVILTQMLASQQQLNLGTCMANTE